MGDKRLESRRAALVSCRIRSNLPSVVRLAIAALSSEDLSSISCTGGAEGAVSCLLCLLALSGGRGSFVFIGWVHASFESTKNVDRIGRVKGSRKMFTLLNKIEVIKRIKLCQIDP